MKGATVEEQVVSIQVNGQLVSIATCTPEKLEAFAVGRLVGEGYINTRADILDLRVNPRQNCTVIEVELSLPAAQAGEGERRHRTQHGCGLLYFLDCAPETLKREWSADPPPLETFPELYRLLFEAGDAHRETGGMHSAALTGSGRLMHHADDVGRHNAVDKVIGAALLAGDDPDAYGLLLTSRISGEIALKCARAGVRWIASRSIPTTLALRVASSASLPLIGRAPGKDAHVHLPGYRNAAS